MHEMKDVFDFEAIMSWILWFVDTITNDISVYLQAPIPSLPLVEVLRRT